jgi:hypothetical protein
LKKDLLQWAGVNRLASALPYVIAEFKNPNPEIAAAAMSSAAKIGGEEAIDALCSVVNLGSAEKINMAINTLAYTAGDVSEPLMKNFDNTSKEGQIAAMQTVAYRKSDKFAEKFISLCSSSDAEISDCAFTNLANVVTSANLPELYKMLGSVDDAKVPSVQMLLLLL